MNRNGFAEDDMQKQRAFVSVAKDHLLSAREAQRFYLERNRVHKEYQVGDWVILKSEEVSANLRADLPEKWRPRFTGLLKVLEKSARFHIRSNYHPV